jgi:hypothetical protein
VCCLEFTTDIFRDIILSQYNPSKMTHGEKIVHDINSKQSFSVSSQI